MNLQDYFNQSIDFETYYNQIQQVIDDGNSSDSLYDYYGLNMQRIKRLQKKVQLSQAQEEKLNMLDKNIQFLIITEGWCGDAAQIIPVMEKIDEASDKIQTRMVYRNENLELMNQYLTHGAQSIPIVIGIDENGEELFRWGPRPTFGTELLKSYKSGEITKEEFQLSLQKTYNKDKGNSIIEEILNLIL